MRATGSVEPPGGKGTMILIGPLGQSPACTRFCALTMAGATNADAVLPISTARRRRMVMFASLALIGAEPTGALRRCKLLLWPFLPRGQARSETEKGLPSGSFAPQATT